MSEDGAVLSGTPSTEAVFAAGSATVDLAVATEDDEVAGDGSVVTVTVVAGTGYAVDANASEATVTVEDDDGAAENATPTDLPTIAGTAQVGETLTASAADIADADGLANATFAWQWIANDGTADADIAGMTWTSYTLTAAEVGKTVKVRVAFTDDGGTEETLVSEATAAVAAALPVVSVGAAASPVTEGVAATFTLSRTGDTAAALTVSMSVSADGAVLSGTPGSTVTFGAGSAEATLSVATDDDSVAEADGRVTASVVAGSGYGVDENASAATVDVYDNDEAATTPATAVGDALDLDPDGGEHRRCPVRHRGRRQRPVSGGLVGGRAAVRSRATVLFPAILRARVRRLRCTSPAGAVDAASGRRPDAAERRTEPTILLLDGSGPRLAGGTGRGGEADAHGPGRGGRGARPLGGGCAGPGSGGGRRFPSG